MLKGTVATPGRLTGRLLLSPQARAGSSQRGAQALPAPAQTNQTRDIRGLRGSDGEREATDYVGDGALKKYGVRFTNQVWPGDTLTGKTTIIEIREEDGEKVVDLMIETTNQNDVAVITGNATARIES